MVKRILKIVGIVLASFVVIAGGAVGISALTGGFKKEVIEISKIYFGEDVTNTDITVYTLEDIVETIKFEPANATEKELSVKVLGNDNGVIENIPSTITAGKPLSIKVNKDSKGNNIGGVVTIEAKSSNGLAVVKLRVVVDVNIPDNSLFFTGDNVGKISAAGKTFTMPVSEEEQYIYLKSGLVNAFSLEAGDTNLKSVQVNYTYYRTNGSVYQPQKNLSGLLEVESVFNPEEGRINYYYRIPVTTDEPGIIDIQAKMHRTYAIEQEYKENGFDSLVSTIENALTTGSDTTRTNASIMLGKYNDFLNKYIKYFDTTQDSYAFFKKCIPTGKIAFTLNNLPEIRESFKYVFVTCSATIKVSDIKLKGFTSLSELLDKETNRSYCVFDSESYTIDGNYNTNIVNKFGLTIKTDKDYIPGAQEAKEYMYDTLVVKPYLYLDKAYITNDNKIEFDGEKDVITWSGRKYSFIPVYGFVEHTPILYGEVDKGWNEGSVVTGYLLLLTDTDEYLSISEATINGKRQWNVKCNTPLPSEQRANDKNIEIYKALYFGFEVTGLYDENEDDNIPAVQKTMSSFTRVYINYQDYTFNSNDESNLAFESVYPYMTINDNLSKVDTGTTKLITQDIALAVNYNTTPDLAPTYSSVMYFVESNSNVVGGGSKVATVGKYKFVKFINSNTTSLEKEYYQYDENADSALIGERIPTFSLKQLTDDKGNPIKDANGEIQYIKQYYLQALNAAFNDPVYVFAVVYLSDKNGNPIDINGRRIIIEDEQNISNDNIPELVVIRMTSYDVGNMHSVEINSYIEEINFYTDSLISHDITDKVTIPEGYLNRNVKTAYLDKDDVNVDNATLNKVNDYLKLKFLKDNYFTLYVTPFELDNLDGEASINKLLSFKDINGKQITKPFVINTNDNKQIGFNNICNDFNNYGLSITGTNSTYVSVYTKEIVYDESNNPQMIKYVLHCSSDNSVSGSISIDASSSKIPYSTLLSISPDDSDTAINGKYNWVNYVSSSLEITNLSVRNVDESGQETLDMATKLYAQYAQGKSDGSLQFNKSVLQNNTINRDKYVLYLNNGEINYETTNNLMFADDEFNLELVDCSQAGTRQDIPEDVINNDKDKYYSTIDEYIEHYVVGANGTQISYSNASGIMSFAETYAFDNIDPTVDVATDTNNERFTNHIYFGDKTFDIDKISNTVNINGYKLNVVQVTKKVNDNETATGEYRLIIKQGEYFPLVEENKYALIYNEKFVIESADGNKFTINEYGSNQVYRRPISVTKTASILLSDGSSVAYNPASNDFKYLKDRDQTNAHIPAINVSEDGKFATLKFIQGEEVGSYQLDPNGDYKLEVEEDGKWRRETYVKITDPTYRGPRYSIRAEYVQDNTGNLYFAKDEYGEYIYEDGEYKLIDVNDSSDTEQQRYSVQMITATVSVNPQERYSKKGVVVYLLINFQVVKTGLGGSEFNFYQALKYELVQEEVEITGINYQKVENDELVEYKNSSDNGHRLEIEAGKKSYIYLRSGYSLSDAVISCKAIDEPYFFDHVKFSIATEGTDITCMRGRDPNGYDCIIVDVPNYATAESVNIKMKYNYKGASKEVYFYLAILPNIEFKVKDGAKVKETAISHAGSELQVYSISLSAGNWNIVDLFKSRFDYEGKVSLSRLDNFTYTHGDLNDELTNILIGKDDKTYVEYKGGQINRNYLLFNINLDSLTDPLPIKLHIEIIPNYVIDLGQLDINNSNNITIFNGENIYGNGIRLYKNTIDINTIKDSNNILTHKDGELTEKELQGMVVNYNSIFTITPVDNLDGALTVTNGKIKLNYVPTVDTDVKLKVSYPGLATPIEFVVTIRGIVLNYSPSGKMLEDSVPDKTTLQKYYEDNTTKDLTINIADIKTFECEDYFLFTTGDVSVYAVLVDNVGNMVVDSAVVANTKYNIAYAKLVNGNWYIIENIGYTLTINPVSE